MLPLAVGLPQRHLRLGQLLLLADHFVLRLLHLELLLPVHFGEQVVDPVLQVHGDLLLAQGAQVGEGVEAAALEALPHEDVGDPQLRRGHPRVDVVRKVEGLARVFPDLLEELDALLVVLGYNSIDI